MITYAKFRFNKKEYMILNVDKRIAVKQNENYYSRQHMLHVSVITGHPKALST
jgi:hypothetical protein